MGKTPDYTRKAIDKYNLKFDKITIRLPAGMREKITAFTGLSANAYINNLVAADLARLEAAAAGGPEDPEEGLPDWVIEYTK